ncbi:MAG: HAD-IA family hydrolase [Burkholderiaceae bacterium]|jgi:phosphoglycolate phosphatase|nr:HAD-IA family hydrolase [Burkholderiaceae bacterium]
MTLPQAAALVLFDLDGTLADTAPDLAATANAMRVARGFDALPFDVLRPLASHGARGLLGRALGVLPEQAEYEALRQEFFDRYEAALCVHTRLFGGIEPLLADLESAGRPWGIVTNKIARFTDPLVAALDLTRRAACVVSGDTTAHAKPHPAPLLHAAALAARAAEQAIYVGDDLRDIQAGRAAGMATVAVRYGYLGEATPIEHWGADHIAATPAALHRLLSDAAPKV